MKLIRWMREQGLNDDAVAGLVGDCTSHAVRKWKYGERTPGAETIVKIETISGGKVTLRDFTSTEAGAT